MTKGRLPQPLLIRITHWVHIPAFVVLAMSGLQILRAYPYFGPQGARYEWVPLQAWDTPEWMRAGGGLAGARHLHFAFAWLLVIIGLIYVGYLLYSREWKRRFFWPPRDAKPALRQLLHYVRIRKRPATLEPSGYNGLQRIAYTSAITLMVLEIVSGLAIWKPVQLQSLAWLMGGYDGARVVHFLALLGLIGFVILHVIMVVVHYRQFPEMVTGGEREPVIAAPADADGAASPKPQEMPQEMP